MTVVATDQNFLTRTQAAEYLGLKTQTLANNAKRGPAYHKLFGSVRYSRADLDSWAKQQRVQPIGAMTGTNVVRLRACA